MRILALNGGGTAGYASCLLLQKLEQETKQPCWKLFDLVCGCSTGAIIAGAIASGMDAGALVDLYVKDIPTIFKKPRWPFWRGWFGPAKYDAGALEDLLEQIFRDMPMSKAKVACMVNATQMSPRVQPWFWKSWRDGAPLFRDVIRASSAAPTFFKPKTIGDQVFVDGALCANNPSHCAVAEALRLGVALDDIMLVNLQLSAAPRYDATKATGLHSIADWAPEFLKVMLSANVEVSEYITSYLVRAYIDLDFNFPQAIDYWDAAFKLEAEKKVNAYWVANGNRVVNAVLAGKKASPSSLAETTKVAVLKNDSPAEGSNGGNAVDSRADH